MLKSEIFPYYRNTVKALETCFSYIKDFYAADSVDTLVSMRGYSDEEHAELFTQMGIGLCSFDNTVELPPEFKDANLLTTYGTFQLNNRFIIPIESVSGDLVGLVGYYPDDVKYIVSSAPFFSKDCILFNFKQAYELSWTMFDGYVILVEGLFDCLSLRAIGLPAVATMGSTVSKAKGTQLSLFKKVLAIPDDDKTGRKALDIHSKNYWNVPSNTTFLRFEGGEFPITPEISVHCKDMDNFVSWYDTDDVIEILLQYKNSTERMEVLSLCQ